MSFLSESNSSASRRESCAELKEKREATIEFLEEMMTDDEIGLNIKQVSVYARLLQETDTDDKGLAAARTAATVGVLTVSTRAKLKARMEEAVENAIGMLVFGIDETDLATKSDGEEKSGNSAKKMCQVYHSMAMVKLEDIPTSCLVIERFDKGIAFQMLSIPDFKQFLKKEKFSLITKTKTKSVPTMNLINLIKKEAEIDYHAWWQNCLILSAKILAVCQVPWEGLETPEGTIKETIRMLRIINEHLGNEVPVDEGSWSEMAMVGIVAAGGLSKQS